MVPAVVMRAVVVGPYPPTADPHGDVTLARVRTLQARGYEVEVVSPEPSAASHCLRTDTAWGAWRLGRVVRDADLVVVGTVSLPGRRPTARLAAPLLARSLARARAVERGEPDDDQAASERPRTRGARERVERWRAGAPTLIRRLSQRGLRRR